MIYKKLLRKQKIEQVKDTKGVIRSRKSKDRQYDEKKTHKCQTMIYKHYTESSRLNNTNLTKTEGELRCSGTINKHLIN